jgi:hypothetical protein
MGEDEKKTISHFIHGFQLPKKAIYLAGQL